MRRLVYTPRAETDLIEIWRFTVERWDTDQADGYIDRIMSTCLHLADGVLPGKDAGAIQPGLRSQSTGAHVVFYREGFDGLLVIRVLHQRMDPSSHLDER